MLMVNTVLVMAVLALAGVCWRLDRINQRRLRQLGADLAALNNRVRKRQMDLLEFRNKKRLLESTVTTGATAVEAVHRTLSSTAFELIDRFSTSEDLRHSARQVRSTHDRTSRTVYRSLRTTNRTLHALADMMLERRSGRRRRDD